MKKAKQQNNELITVIINVYNGEKYINKCLDSIINQTYKNLEILIINDGSTDDTLKICQSYKDKRIRIITTKNQGLSLSRNTGIDNAKGEYLYFIDVDDFIELDTIEYLYKLLKEYDADISTCDNLKFEQNELKKIILKEKINKITNKEMLIKILLDKKMSVTIWNKLIKRDIIKDLKFEDRIINDMAFTHRLVLKTNKIVFSNQVKYYYYKHFDSVSNVKPSTERLTDYYDVCINRYYYIKRYYPNFKENNTALLKEIVFLYLKENQELIKILEQKGARKIFNKIFTFKILLCKIGFREKIKILLHRINPKLNLKITHLYLRLRGKK